MGLRALGLLLVLCLGGCESLPQALDAKKIFQQDMIVEVNGVKGDGVFVVSQADSYAIKIESKGKIDLMVVKTCNREVKIDKPVKGGLFGRGKAMEFVFTPNARERETGCPLELSALNESSKNSFAFIAFEKPAYQLPVRLECNGDSRSFSGTSACQSRAGLKQVAKFDQDVHIASQEERCKVPAFTRAGEIVFPLPVGFCIYVFMEKAKPHRMHRMYTVGYEDFIVKGLEQ